MRVRRQTSPGPLRFGTFPWAIFQSLSARGSPQWEGKGARGQARAYTYAHVYTHTRARAHTTHTHGLLPPRLPPPPWGAGLFLFKEPTVSAQTQAL